MNPNKVNPQLKDVLDAFKQEIMGSINCVGIGKIESFDESSKMARLSMAYKRKNVRVQGNEIFDETLDYPALVDCPVFFISGGGSGLWVPIKQGDTAIILFNDRDMDNFISSGNISAPASSRMHSFSDAIALVGISNAIKTFGEDIVLYNEGAQVGIGEGKIEVKNDSENLLGLLSDLIAQIKLITVTSSAPGNPTGVPLNAAAFDLINTRLQGLLK